MDIRAIVAAMFLDHALPDKQAGEVRIAHLSDLHINLHRSDLHDQTRRFLKRPIANNLEWTQRILSDARHHGVDHVVITGDLSDSGYKSQFAALRERLDDFDDPERLSVVPGNHDVSYREYVRGALTGNVRPAKLTGFVENFGHLIPPRYPDDIRVANREVFPWVKYIGPGRGLALIGVDTTRGVSPRVPGLNSLGKISRQQIAALRELLREPALRDRTKVLIMHHHPMLIPFYNWFDNFKDLSRSKQLLDLLYDNHVDLILHGHKHQPFCWESHTYDEHNFTVVCAGPPDAYANGATRPKDLIYNIYALREGEIHVHYQKCAVRSRIRRKFRYSRSKNVSSGN